MADNLFTDHIFAPFETVSEYMEYLLSQNIRHLAQQQDSVSDEDDARRKITSRRQLKALIPPFAAKEHNHGPFKLYCDDFRPRQHHHQSKNHEDHRHDRFQMVLYCSISIPLCSYILVSACETKHLGGP